MTKKKVSEKPATISSKWPLNQVQKSTFRSLLFFVGLAFILYGNTLGHDYVLDDEVVFLRNNYVQNGLGGIGDIVTHGFITGFNDTNDQSYRPLVLISFAIEHELFGNNPAVGHLINLLLYALCGFMVWRLMKTFFKEAHPWTPLLMAMVFMVHPVHTEAVANVKGRDDILHFLFALGAMYYLMKYVANQDKKQLIWSGLLYFLALTSKEMAVTFVAVVPLTLWIFSCWKWKQILLHSGIYVGILIIYLIIRSSILTDIGFEEIRTINNGLAAAPDELSRISTALAIMGRYVWLLFVPHPLSWDYSFNQIPIVGLSSWQTLLSMAVLLAMITLAIRLFIKKNPMAWGILFFLVTMSIVSNIFIMVGATMAERFLFTPSLGFSLVLVLLWARLTRSDLTNKMLFKKSVFVIPLLTIILIFGIKTVSRNTVWKNTTTLYESGLITAPNSSRTWNAMATNYRQQAEVSQSPVDRAQKLQSAVEHYTRSVQILDENFDSWYNLGVTYNMMGATNNALQAFRKTVEVNPDYTAAWNNIGVYYFNNGNLEEAEIHFKKAYDTNPLDGNTVANLGLIDHSRGNLGAAIDWYLQALQLDPQNKNTAKNLAIAYRQNGEAEKAVPYENFSRQP